MKNEPIKATAIVRYPFLGDPAELPQPRKVGGNMEPLSSSRYHRPGYAQRRAAASQVTHFRNRRSMRRR